MTVWESQGRQGSRRAGETEEPAGQRTTAAVEEVLVENPSEALGLADGLGRREHEAAKSPGQSVVSVVSLPGSQQAPPCLAHTRWSNSPLSYHS